MELILKSLRIKKTSGFTLIELLVAIGILGILLSGLMLAIDPVAQLQKGRDSKRIEELKSLQTALELYYQDHGEYPSASNNRMFDADIAAEKAWGSPWDPYMKAIPKDPSKTFVYWADPAKQSYAIYASLDRDDNTCKGSKLTPCDNVASRLSGGTTVCGGVCNFGVTSLNISP